MSLPYAYGGMRRLRATHSHPAMLASFPPVDELERVKRPGISTGTDHDRDRRSDPASEIPSYKRRKLFSGAKVRIDRTVRERSLRRRPVHPAGCFSNMPRLTLIISRP